MRVCYDEKETGEEHDAYTMTFRVHAALPCPTLERGHRGVRRAMTRHSLRPRRIFNSRLTRKYWALDGVHQSVHARVCVVVGAGRGAMAHEVSCERRDSFRN